MHPAWFMVALAFATQFVANGVGIYSFGILLGPLVEDLDASRAGVSFINFYMSIAGAFMGPLLGRAVLVIPINRIMAVGALTLSLSFYAMSFADSLWQLQLGYAVGVSFGLGTLSGVPAATLIVNWFEQRRALALGIAGVGVSLAGFVMAPVTAAWVDAYGWRVTFQLFSAFSLSVVPLIGWFAWGHPSERGAAAYGASERAAGEAVTTEAPLSTQQILRNPNLWYTAIAGGITFMGATALITHSPSLGQDAGYDRVAASWLVAILAVSAAVAKLLFGAIAERTGERGAFLISLGLQMLGLIGIAQLRGSYALLLTMTSVFGLGMGGALPIMNALLARLFGPASFGPAMGLCAPIMTATQAIGAPLLGYIYDVRGDYTLGLWLFAGALLIPTAGMLLMRVEAPQPVTSKTDHSPA